MCQALFMAVGCNSERNKILSHMELTFCLFVKFKYDNIIELLAYGKCPVSDGYCNCISSSIFSSCVLLDAKSDSLGKGLGWFVTFLQASLSHTSS